MDFKEATDRLMDAGCTARDLAGALGLAPQTVRAMRLDPSSSAHRSPPKGWNEALEKLARAKGEELRELADALRAERQE